MLKNIVKVVVLIILINSLSCSSSESISKEVANKYGLTQTQYDYVKNETIRGGQLDFEKQFHANRLILIDNVAYNRKDASLYTWALEMKKLGIKSAEDAIDLYEKLTEVRLRDTQKKAMNNAFNK